MKKLTRVICVMAFCLAAIMGMSSVCSAATVGDQLACQEDGWKRLDDLDANITYSGEWYTADGAGNYQNALHGNNTAGSSYKFKFYGTKVRLLVAKYCYDHSDKISVKLDGVETFYSNVTSISEGLKQNTIAFEKTGLDLGYHVIEVENKVNKKMNIDAIDIDANSDYEGNSAILEIVMTNGTIKEYSLTNDELEAFLTWYDNRSDGVGKSYYRIPKKSNVKPFLTRKEYLSFDKIYSFEVKDYNE